MPLMPGMGPKILSQNIQEMLHGYKQKGSIGNSGPISKDAARKRAAAIAYSEQARGK